MALPSAHPDHDPTEANQRAEPRQRALVSAMIVFDNKMSTFECVVRNRSAGGFLLKVADTLGIPGQFDLLVGQDKTRYRCNVQWRSKTELGVRIMEDASAAASEPVAVPTPSPQDELAARLAERFPHLAKKG